VSPELVVFGLTAVVVLGAMGYFATWMHPATFLALALGATIFSGQSGQLGFPIGPDRLLFAAAIGALILGTPGAVLRRRVQWRPVHVALAAVAIVAVSSAVDAGTFFQRNGMFALLDRLGLVPFAVFALAPVLFAEERHRRFLLGVLVAAGGYLGATALFEGLGVDRLVFPSYILDPNVGIHSGRARGPFVEAVAMGMGLYGCAVASAVAAVTWRATWARVTAGAVGLLCLFGTLFTLTRAVWLATAVASVVALLFDRRTRKLAFVGAGAAAVVVGLTLTTIDTFSEDVEQRAADQRPLWDRYNTNAAAVDAALANPLSGLGWQRFTSESREYLRQGDEFPLTGARIEVHNVFLSHAAELGLLGASLWLLALTMAVGGAIWRRGPPELHPWRIGLVALAVQWLIIASFGPLSYAFPNLLLWTWAGVVASDHISRPRTPAAAPVPALRHETPA
jgi:putative inorganic carbon (hco3(-)) transporter